MRPSSAFAGVVAVGAKTERRLNTVSRARPTPKILDILVFIDL
jgi:hypothetical protein